MEETVPVSTLKNLNAIACRALREKNAKKVKGLDKTYARLKSRVFHTPNTNFNRLELKINTPIPKRFSAYEMRRRFQKWDLECCRDHQ